MLFTYGDVVRRARAYLDDQDAQVYTDTFLLENVNGSLNTISSALLSNSVRTVLYRTPVPILVPAGQTKLARVEDPVHLMNLKASSDDFRGPTGSWVFTDSLSLGGRPSAITNGTKTDPEGGTTASEWSYPTPAGSITDYAQTIGAINYTSPSDNNFVTGAIWLRSATLYPMTILLSVGIDNSGSFTAMATEAFQITSTWQRIHLTAGPFSTSAPGTAALKIEFQYMDPTEATRKIELWRCVLTDKSFDILPDIKTNSVPAYALLEALPTNYVAAQALWEKGVQDQDYQFQPMYGPAEVPNAVQGPFLRWWNTREGEISFLGATSDRLVRMDYWGDVGSFKRQTTGTSTDASQAFPFADPSAFEAACALTAYNATRGKGSLDQAHEFASLSPDGIGGSAGFHLTNLINTQIKMKQSVAQRRQPYFGVRYPGLTDRVLGGY